MRTSSTLAGVLFGALLTGALVIPLYIGLPSRYLNDWYYVHEQAGLFAVVGALVVWCAAGFAGAAANPEEAVRAGTSSGIIASLVAGALIVLPAAAVQGCAELLIQIQASPLGGVRLARLSPVLGDTLVRAMWLPAIAAMGMMLTGPALGAVGGVIYDLWRGEPSRQGRAVYRSSVPVTGLVVTCISFAGLLLLLREAEATYMPLFGVTLDFFTRARLTAPVTLVAVLCSALGWWVIRDAAVMYRAGLRLRGGLWLLLGMSVLPVLLVEAAALYPKVYTTPAVWMSILGTAFTLLVGLIVCARGDEDRPKQPRTVGDLVGEAALHGVVVVSIPCFVGGSSAAALYVFARPYAEALRVGTTEVTAWPAEAGLNLVMQGHWFLFLAGIGVAVAYLVPAVPLTLMAKLRPRD